MKQLKDLLLGTAISLMGMTVSAQELTLPVDPAPSQFDFVHRTLVLQFTGTGCSNCPFMIQAMDQLLEDETYNNKFRLAISHGYNSDDPMYVNPDNLYTLYLPDFYPRVLIGFTEKLEAYSVSANLNNLKHYIDLVLKRDMKAGLTVNSQVDGNSLNVKVGMKAVQKGEFSIGCWLLEDGIYAWQSGGMGYITHNDAVRHADYPPHGKEVGTIEAGKTAEASFSMTIQKEWVTKNCHLIVFVCVKQDENYIITNTITAPLDTEVPYEYESISALEKVESTKNIHITYLSNHQVNVSAASTIKNLAVYNLKGQLMLQLSPDSDTVSLSLGNLPAGTYTVSVDCAEGRGTQKIIKH